jgi:hypothetical protein
MGMMILMDAATASATGTPPVFSRGAVVHTEDTNPQPIATPPGPLAGPVHSLWQTSTIGIRMTMDLSWGLRRAGSVAWMTGNPWTRIRRSSGMRGLIDGSIVSSINISNRIRID